MEKIRRARINDSLDSLKRILLESKMTLKTISKNTPRTAKLEKADILEMTVKYLQQLHEKMKVSSILQDTEDKRKNRIIAIRSNEDVITKSDHVTKNVSMRQNVVTAQKSEIAIRAADSSSDSLVMKVSVLPTQLITREIFYVLPNNTSKVQKQSSASSKELWRPW